MKNILFFLCLFIGYTTLGAQMKSDSIPLNNNQIDSTELLIALLSKDSMVYRPEGDPYIISLIKQNDMRAMEFLLLHCHERPLITREGGFAFEDMQHYFARRVYIEDLIVHHGDKWIFVSAFSKIIKENEFSDDRLYGLCSVLGHIFFGANVQGHIIRNGALRVTFGIEEHIYN